MNYFKIATLCSLGDLNLAQSYAQKTVIEYMTIYNRIYINI